MYGNETKLGKGPRTTAAGTAYCKRLQMRSGNGEYLTRGHCERGADRGDQQRKDKKEPTCGIHISEISYDPWMQYPDRVNCEKKTNACVDGKHLGTSISGCITV